MASKIAIHGSKVACVYSDKFMPLLQALGDVVIQRASEVEYDNSSKKWVAFHRSGEQIASGVNREDVIKQEVRWLEERL